ncbi:MAG: hypothetical protein ACP5SI_13465 [Chloroflexia bacterium]
MLPQEVLQHFPLQLLSYKDLLVTFEEVAEGMDQRSWAAQVAEVWPGLVEAVRHALVEVYLYGAVARARGVEAVEQLLAHLEQLLEPDAQRELRLAYVTLLDRIYGALFLQVVRHTPTATCTQEGYFSLAGLYVSRQARVPHGERSALDALLQCVEEGAFRLEMEFQWRPLGGTSAPEGPRHPRRR